MVDIRIFSMSTRTHTEDGRPRGENILIEKFPAENTGIRRILLFEKYFISRAIGLFFYVKKNAHKM